MFPNCNYHSLELSVKRLRDPLCSQDNKSCLEFGLVKYFVFRVWFSKHLCICQIHLLCYLHSGFFVFFCQI